MMRSKEIHHQRRKDASFDFEIIVLTMNRVDSLKRLLDSIEASDYGQDTVRLTVQIDFAPDNAAVQELAESFAYSHGPKVIQVAESNKGLRAAWLEAWKPGDNNKDRHAIILEDDLEVSPVWYQWVKRAWDTYQDATDMAGISLNRQDLIPDKSVKNFSIVNDHKPFLYKLVGSQGYSPHPAVWQQFLDFCATVDLDKFAADVPGLITSEWYSKLPKRGMWTQLFIYFCEQHNLYNLYVTLPDEKALVTHWREIGEHFQKAGGPDFALAEAVSYEFPARPVKYGWDGAVIEEDNGAASSETGQTAATEVEAKDDNPFVKPKLETVGTEYGGWTYDVSKLTADSIVYSIGLGMDTSWDEGIMAKHGLQVWGCDPTPKSLKYVESRKELQTDRFHLIAEGLSTTKHKATFTLPANPEHVSMREGDHTNLGGKVEVQVNTLENWMETNGQTHMDIVKMDIEGAEYDVIEDWIARDFFPMDQLLVEWHFRWLEDKSRHNRVIQGLKDRGWYIAHSQNKGQEQTFLRKGGYVVYGGYAYDPSKLTSDSIVYSVGLGEDSVWDEEIMAKHGVQLWGFDPTPRSKAYVESRQELQTDRFHFVPEGLSTSRRRATFTISEDPNNDHMREGSYTGIIDSLMGRSVTVQLNSLENWLKTLGHMRLSILKMDIQGAEYDVIEDWIKWDFFPMEQLLVKWHVALLEDKSRHERMIQGLKIRGWYVAHSQNDGEVQTFVRSTSGAYNDFTEVEFDTDFADSESKEKLMKAINDIMDKHGVVAIQLLNEGYVEMTLSWICNVKHFPGVLERTLFIATDQIAYDDLTDWDSSLKVVHVNYEAPKALSYGQYAYYAFMLFRTRLLCHLLANDVTLWLIESDALWIRDPTDEVLATEGDMVTMSDGKPPTLVLQGGFQLLRPTKATISVWAKLLRQFAETMERSRAGADMGDKGSEQLMMNKLIRNEPELNFAWLDPSHYFPGLYYREPDYAATAKEPKVILNNYIIGNDAKMARAKEWGHWFLMADLTCDDDSASKIVVTSGTTSTA